MRLVSLCPSVTKLIFDLGRGSDLVGVTKYCVHPADACARIAKIGGTKDPDIEKILALDPDLAFLNQEENRRQDWETLERAGVACSVTYPVTLDETESAVLAIGEALDRAQAARSIAAGIRRSRERAQRSREALDHLSWAYLIWRKPWMAVNGDTYIHCLLSAAGGPNVFADMEPRYPEITAAQLGQANPSGVLLSSEPFPFKQKHLRELSRLSGLPAERFRVVDGELLSWHGAFTERGLDYAVKLFASFADPKPA